VAKGDARRCDAEWCARNQIDAVNRIVGLKKIVMSLPRAVSVTPTRLSDTYVIAGMTMTSSDDKRLRLVVSLNPNLSKEFARQWSSGIR
jgi:hypothetical protein